MKKTFGGDRLGSGKKMQVELHNYGRSTHDKSRVVRTTMSSGTLVPLLKEVVLPGDHWFIKMNANIKTLPTIGPLFGSYKWQLDVYTADVRLYNSWLHNNKANIGKDMSVVKLPQMELTAINARSEYNQGKIDNAQIDPSCVLKYLGISGVGWIKEAAVTAKTRKFNAVPLLAYWEIVKNYYMNKQEEVGAVIHTGQLAPVETVDDIEINGNVLPDPPNPAVLYPFEIGQTIVVNYTGADPRAEEIIIVTFEGNYSVAQLIDNPVTAGNTIQGLYNGKQGPLNAYGWRYINNEDIVYGPPRVVQFPLENIDEMREQLMMSPGNVAMDIKTLNIEPYSYLFTATDDVNPLKQTQEGLAVKTYQSDIFNNWVSTDWIDEVTTKSSINVSGGTLTMDQLNISKKIYDMMNRIMVSGGTYDDWMDVMYTHERYTRPEIPIYHGGLIKELVFQEVVSNAEATTEGGENQPLGTIAGKGVMADKHKGGQVDIKVSEIGYLLAIGSLTPRIDYSQGNDWDMLLQTMDDFHKPAMDGIGFEDLQQEEMAWWTTYSLGVSNQWQKMSAGKQPAWIKYMTAYNKTFGKFAIDGDSMFMTLNRRYEAESAAEGPAEIKDLTTYIDPAKYNNIFAQTEIDAQNFWVQVGFDIEVRRVMSAKLMPTI